MPRIFVFFAYVAKTGDKIFQDILFLCNPERDYLAGVPGAAAGVAAEAAAGVAAGAAVSSSF